MKMVTAINKLVAHHYVTVLYEKLVDDCAIELDTEIKRLLESSDEWLQSSL